MLLSPVYVNFNGLAPYVFVLIPWPYSMRLPTAAATTTTTNAFLITKINVTLETKNML